MFGRTVWLGMCAFALWGCSSAGPGGVFRGAPPTALPSAGPTRVESGGSASEFRVAALLPLSGANAERGEALRNAAKLALSGADAPRLDTKDTAGTPAGAASAAQAAIRAGDQIILGPLTAPETAAVAAEARQAGVPVLAFTSDASQAQPGVWVLGITPEQQVRRLVAAAQAEGRTRFAALLPESEFGRAMGAALTRAVAEAGLTPPVIRTHAAGLRAMTPVIREFSDYANRRGPIDAKLREARARHDAEGRKLVSELSRAAVPPPPFDALLLADTGEQLDELASLLSYYDVSAPQVRFLGPALWADPATRAAAARALRGAWYAAPDPAFRTAYAERYQETYGAPPPGLADLAYDAASIARLVGANKGNAMAVLTQSNGFLGVDGVLALRPDGRVARGLAVFEVVPGGSKLVSPAPQTAAGPGM